MQNKLMKTYSRVLKKCFQEKVIMKLMWSLVGNINYPLRLTRVRIFDYIYMSFFVFIINMFFVKVINMYVLFIYVIFIIQKNLDK